MILHLLSLEYGMLETTQRSDGNDGVQIIILTTGPAIGLAEIRMVRDSPVAH